MSSVLLAISAEEMIETVGSYAGLAAIVGLGVLALLYFAQAREVRRLREWAGRAPERAAELGQRVQADAQRRVVAQPLAPATTAAQQAEAARTGAPAAAAKLPPPPPQPAPIAGPPGQLARAVSPGQPGAGTVPAAPAANAAPTAPPGGASAPAAPAVPTVPAAAPTGPAAPAAQTGAPAGPAAQTAPAAGIPPAATPAAAAAQRTAAPSQTASPLDNGAGGQETHESDAARPEPMPSPPPRPVLADHGRRMSGARIGAIVAGAVVAILAAAALTVTLLGGEDETRPNDFGTTQPAATPGQQEAPAPTGSAGGASVDRRATRVAVLNGTTQTGLARAVADEVEKARFTIAGTENNADQAVPTTTVSFRPGNERAAQIVAQVLQIDRSLVRPVDANTSAAADADVIVIVGADKIG